MIPGTQLSKGTYIVAVSGGVDSVALLDMLQKQPGLSLVVAHFDHGIRSDSGEDARFVAQLAHSYGLSFISAAGQLGPGASEAAARQARYAFLRRVLANHGAAAIVTAHHQDDLLETAVINIIRGTGRKGLSSLGQTTDVVRPLLHVSKQDLLAYAEQHKLAWREDSTNQDDAYLRNHIRHNILPRLSLADKQKLLAHINQAAERNELIDELLPMPAGNQLDRQQFIMLPHAVAREVMAAWMRANDLRAFNRSTLERAVWAAKTFHPGQQTAMLAGVHLVVNRKNLALTRSER